MDKTKIIQVQILNAFVDEGKGGNPAGVVLSADTLSSQEKLKIAKKVGLSETAFVSKSNTAEFKLDFFTPTKQIAHCGHATVATFSYLKQIGMLKKDASSKETIDGKRQIKMIGEIAFMEQLAPTYVDVCHKETTILKSLGLQKTDLIENTPIKLVNTGNSFIIIPIKNELILRNIKPDFNLIRQVSEEFDLIGYYVFAKDLNNIDMDVTTRMFAPRYGILEEAGTGMAAGPLACYLFNILKINKNRFCIQQGHFMDEPSPSLILVDLLLKNGKINGLMAGGKGMLKSQIEVQINV